MVHLREPSTALAAGLVLLVLAGCATRRAPCRRPCPEPAVVAGCPVLPPATPSEPSGAAEADAYLLYAADGEPVELAGLVEAARRADVVLFGELHGHPAAGVLERRVFEALLDDPRPVTLALEFFERDVQPDLDRYLEGAIDEATFRERTRQTAAYPQQHRPLVEMAKARGAPVVAANAPRALVTRWRKSELDDYDAFLEGLSAEERTHLPEATTEPDDAYRARFLALMGERGPAFFRSQALWDDAMAETVAALRREDPERRVLLVVGAFHVTGRLGTATKVARRRPRDRRLVVVVRSEGGLSFRPRDRGAADVIVKVRPPARSEAAEAAPNPHGPAP